MKIGRQMANPIEAIFVVVGAATAIGICGAALTFAVITVCRWMAWSPINLTVNYNDYRDTE